MKDAYLRRQALQLAAQLPEKRHEALKVLAFLTVLVTGFMAGQTEAPERDTETGDNVVSLNRPAD